MLEEKNLQNSAQNLLPEFVPSLKNLGYADRLAKLNLTSLEIRKIRGDLIQFFKIEKKFNIVKWSENLQHFTSSVETEGPAQTF